MTAVIYARYSSDNQREESIEGQIRECTAYAEKNGITVIKHYIDRAFSAKTDNRPEFQQMIKDSGKKLFDVVLVWKFDRFARNRFDSANYKMILKKNGVHLISVMEPIAEGSQGILVETLLEGMAEYYSAELSEKVIRGQTENALKGKCTGGTGTIGYKIDEDKFYHLDPLTSPLVLEAFQRYDNGEKMVAIYQKMKDMIDAGYWGDGILSTDFNTERNMFEAGKAAFTVDGTWNCGNFQNDSDTTLFDAQKIGVTRIPYIDEANKTVEMGGGSDTYYITTLNKSDEEIAATVKFIKYLTSVDSINEMCKSSPTTYAEKVTIDTGNYLLDDVNAIMAENTESKLEIPTYDSNTAAMDTIRNSLQALATGASAQEVGDDIVDKMSAYE